MRHVLLHGHIFKNAGTTLDWALQRSFGPRFLYHQEEVEMRNRGEKRLAEVIFSAPDLTALSSHHMPIPTFRLANFCFHSLYLLRHPLRRAISVYSFERRQDVQTRGAKAAKRMGLQDYLRWRLEPDVPNTVRNYQTAYLAGCHRQFLDAGEMASLFGEAQTALGKLSLVGLVERFDDSMVLFETLLRPWFPDIDLAYVTQNRSQVSGEAGTLGEFSSPVEEMGKLAPAMVDANAYDLALYQLVSDKLDHAINGITGFEEKLRKFQERCMSVKDAHG
ncbi:hypothetical protein FV139_16540 [Parahaliea maris]|uniref:Sulfotransferase family protein n=1 Tax=Parahaliea maris TaxID=2716870 RepID=A0A5C8ZS56_9GAMM|nr:sulfotransferase family 2 domain-containing protein [Parahaliea maris]TXS91338.1 hypothetical protein FV139_16540 [Parahaliea maris]